MVIHVKVCVGAPCALFFLLAIVGAYPTTLAADETAKPDVDKLIDQLATTCSSSVKRPRSNCAKSARRRWAPCARR